MRWRGERSGARPVRTSVERRGGPAKAQQDRDSRDGEDGEDDERPPAAAAEAADGVPKLVAGLVPGRKPTLLPRAHLEAIGQPQVGDREGDHGDEGDQGRPGRAERPAAPDDEGDRGFDRHDDPAVRVHGRQEPGPGGGRRDGPGGWMLEAEDEEVDGESRGEGEERVHTPEAPVHGEHPRARGHDRRGDTGRTPIQPPAQVVAERHRPDGEDDGDPAQGLGRGVEKETEVDEEEMERGAAAVPDRRRDDLSERPRADQTGDGLVLEERLRADVGRELHQEIRARGGHRPPRREAREASARRRHPRGRPGPEARARARPRATPRPR